MISKLLPRRVVDAVIDDLAMAIVILNRRGLLYANAAARALTIRLKTEHTTDLAVLLRDHVESVASHLQATGRSTTLITAGNGEPFYIHLRQFLVKGHAPMVVACVRHLAPEREAVASGYGLSTREAQVVDLVLRGYGNRDVATALGITPATAKKHLTSIFDKVGVDSRSQLISRLA
jgi:DNA-binding CsgD family transcriptional regulator